MLSIELMSISSIVIKSLMTSHPKKKKVLSINSTNSSGMVLVSLIEEVSQLNHLSIVKSSIFLVCRWSKAMQNAVAMKLQHTLFSPNNTIYQPPGKERIYLIKSGLIGVYAATFHLKKQLKIISTDISKLVSDNCYGYSAALSQKKIRLQAIAK